MLTKLAKKFDLGKNGKQIGGIRVPNNWKNSVSFFFFLFCLTLHKKMTGIFGNDTLILFLYSF